MYLTRAKFLSFIFALALLLTACGQAPPQEVALQATIAALETQVSGQSQPTQSSQPSQEALHPTERSLVTATLQVVLPTKLPSPTSEPVSLNHIGSWEIAYEGMHTISQYEGRTPAEGHSFYLATMLANDTNPLDDLATFGPPTVQSYFNARWKTFVYPAFAVGAPYAPVPPGWPSTFWVIFDIPSAAEGNVEFFLVPHPEQGDTAEEIKLDTLPKELHPQPPPTIKLGTTVTNPNVSSITVTEVKPVKRSVVGPLPEGKLQYSEEVSMMITNLGGTDLDSGLLSNSFQLYTTDGAWVAPWEIETGSGGPTIPPGTTKMVNAFTSTWFDKPPILLPILLMRWPKNPPWVIYELPGYSGDVFRHPYVDTLAEPGR